MKYSNEIIEKIIELRNSGKGVTEIGRILQINRGAVSRNLRKLGYSTDRNPLIKDIFRKIDTEEKAYWLGFLSADGYVSKYNQVEVSLQLKDIHHLEKLKKFVNTNTPILVDDHRCRLLFCSKEISKDLADLGCVNNKSLILKAPTEEQVPNYLIFHYMRGYVDGDGCLCFTEKTQSFSFTGNKDFIHNILIRLNWDEKEGSYSPRGRAFQWTCYRKHNLEYLNQLYENCNIYLDRKYEKYKTLTAV